MRNNFSPIGEPSPPASEPSAQGPTVLVAAVASSSHLSGVSRHAANLVRCLLLRSELKAVHLAIAHWQASSLRAVLPTSDTRLHIHEVPVGENSISRNLWYYNQLPRLALKCATDIVHLAYPAPLKRRAFRCPTVTTLHDLYPYDIPANFGFPKMLFNRAILQQCLRACDAIACVSESTMSRLDVYAVGLALQKAVTIFNCVEPGPPMADRAPIAGWDGEPFILCVAQHRRNKNVVLAIRVFWRLLLEGDIPPESKLLILGIEGPETANIRRYLQDRNLSHKVWLLQGISDASLQWCYAHCELLLAPSIIEGFGLPIVEAMLRGCRIVCSDIPAFREVGGGYCEYASLRGDAETAFVEATRTALSSDRPHAAETASFSGTMVAEGYFQLYQKLLGAVSNAEYGDRNKQSFALEGGRR